MINTFQKNSINLIMFLKVRTVKLEKCFILYNFMFGKGVGRF